jgi:uncharacterized metal-binding protein YceD (DUF177 family)
MSLYDDTAKPEFSRTVPVDRLRRGVLNERIEATEKERKALAERFELEAVNSLVADVRLEPMKSGMVRVSGHIDADVVQTCVVSLDSVPATVSEPFAALFAPPEMIGEEDGDIDIDALAEDEEDLPEPILNHRIDIGELAAQHLSLALDPYPRAPGADFSDLREHDDPEGGYDALSDEEINETVSQDEGEQPTQRPFAGLGEKLKKG